MKIREQEIKIGEKKQFYLEEPFLGHNIPITVICGGEGKVTLLTAGIHSAEYVGIQAAIELSRELQPEEIDGTLIILPVVNISGFSHRTMSMVYEDNKNLNRVFPGLQGNEATTADKLAYVITQEFFSIADYYIDLHSGDGYESLLPYIYYVGPTDPDVRERSLAMAECADVDYIIESQSATGGAYNYAAGQMKIPSVLLERGGQGKWSAQEVEEDKLDVRRILDLIYGTHHSVQKRKMEAYIIKDVIYEYSYYTGCWYPCFQVGDRVHPGDKLGTVRNYFGEELYTSAAYYDGIVLYQTDSLNILEDGPMIAYGVLVP